MLPVSWDTAFGVLIVTGIWNIVAVRSQIDHSASYRTTLIVKLAVVVVSGVAAALHIRSRTPGAAPSSARSPASARWPR